MIKVDVNGEEKSKEEFPKLMIHMDGTIVLFTSKDAGTALRGRGGTSLGQYEHTWCTDDFIDFVGSITLSNEG